MRWLSRIKPQPSSDKWEDYFHGHEVLLWEGYPARGFKSTWGTLGMSIFGAPFLFGGIITFGFGIKNLTSGDGMDPIIAGLGLIAFSLPFLGVGLALVFGTWLALYFSHHFVRYALSNKRAYIATSWWNHKMESYPILASNQIEIERGRHDTVWFTKFETRDSDGDKQTKRIGFEQIADGMPVYQLLREVQEKARLRAPTTPTDLL